MRVLLSIGAVARETGGPARSSQGLCAGLERCGCETWLVSHLPGDKAWMPGVKHFVAAARGGYRGALDALERTALDVKPGVIHSNGLWLPYTHAAVVVARRLRLPLVIAPRGTLAPWALNYKKWKKRLAWWLYQRRDLMAADAFHVTSEDEAAQVRTQGFRQPIILLPNGVDLPELSGGQVPQRGRRRRVLYLGRIHLQKGLRELVQAWAEVKRSSDLLTCESSEVEKCGSALGEQKEAGGVKNARTHEFPLWQLELVGPDVAGHQAGLVAEAERLGLKVAVGNPQPAVGGASDPARAPSPPDIIFTGPLDDEEKWSAYARADLVVLPSYTENFGLTVAEGLAAGKPVITTKGTPWTELLGNTGDPEVLKCESSKVRESVTANGANQAHNDNFRTVELPNSGTGRCGWWVDIGKEPLLGALREALALDDAARAEMGAAGRRLVEAKYTWPAVSRQMIEACEWLSKGGVRPPCVLTAE